MIIATDEKIEDTGLLAMLLLPDEEAAKFRRKIKSAFVVLF